MTDLQSRNWILLMSKATCIATFLLVSLIISRTHCLSSGSSGDSNIEYTTLDTAKVRVTSNGVQINTTLTENGHLSQISIELILPSVTYILDLHINSMLFASTYHEKAVGAYNTIDVPVNHIRDHCHYIGQVRGAVDSVAAASVCSGVSGHFIVDQISYHIVPLGKDLLSDVQLSTANDELQVRSCGQGATESPFLRKHHNKVKRDFNWPQDMDGVTKVVEQYLVVDYFQYQSKNLDYNVVANRAKEAANIASSLYQPQNIYLVLVGMEVWTEENKIGVLSGNLSGTLGSFLQYRQTQIKTKNDNAQLITSVQFYGGVVGQAPVGLMCTVSQSGSVCSDVNTNVGAVASTMAHEMGHNFGLIHDTTSCKCTDPAGQCIMWPTSGGNRPALTWSDCSINQLREAFNQGADFCLYNKPSTVYDNRAVCGNGIVEPGEVCDCGKSPTTFCNPSCCNSTTCQLNAGVQCAAGRCCDVTQCKVKKAGEVCRDAHGDCDLPEGCSGADAFCPSDAYKRDGTSCKASGVAAYCYKGKCSSHQSQCQLVWGSSVSNADPSCYTRNNALGTLHANCGAVWGAGIEPEYISCKPQDTLCGKLHCNQQATNLAYYKNFYRISEIQMGSILCKSVIFDLVGEGLQDPGLVPNGAGCGDEMMCLNQKCVDVQSVISNVQSSYCSQNCSNHGVCNNLGQCHCDFGYGPPDCSGSGSGGSIHSNPAPKPGSNKAGLIVGLIFLFIILISAGVAIICVCGKKGKLSKTKQSVIDSLRGLKLPIGKNSKPDTAPMPSRTAPTPSRPAPVRPAPSAPIMPAARPQAAPSRPPVVPARPGALPTVEAWQPSSYSSGNQRFAPPKPPNKPSVWTVASHDNHAYTQELSRPVLPPKPRAQPSTTPHSITPYSVGTGYGASEA